MKRSGTRNIATAFLLATTTVAAVNLFVSEAKATFVKQSDVVESTDIMETTPIVFQGQQYLFESHRAAPETTYGNTYLQLKNLQTGQVTAKFGYGYSLGCAFVSGNQINVFASNRTSDDWFHDIYRFTSTDGVIWSTATLAVPRSSEHLLNSSVCQDSKGYVMAYESDTPLSFCAKFARSTDLATWTKLSVPTFAGPNGNEYSACPCIRYSNGYYYMMYLAENPVLGGQSGYATEIARSKDLSTWEYSTQNPVLTPIAGEGINNSDVDLFEVDGKTYVYYATGDQQSWVNVKYAVYDGTMSNFFASYFPAATPEPGAWILMTTGLAAAAVYAGRKQRVGQALRG
jgi:hypothetical protein